MSLKKLIAAGAGDAAMVSHTNWNAPTILQPAYASKDSNVTLNDGIQALLIMHGLTAKLCINYWLVQDRSGNRQHVSAREDWDEWMQAVNVLAGRHPPRS